MCGVFYVKLLLIQALAQNSVQEKEYIMSVSKVRTDKSVPRVTVWHHSAEPRDAKTVTLGTDLSVRTLNSCQILII